MIFGLQDFQDFQGRPIILNAVFVKHLTIIGGIAAIKARSGKQLYVYLLGNLVSNNLSMFKGSPPGDPGVLKSLGITCEVKHLKLPNC